MLALIPAACRAGFASSILTTSASGPGSRGHPPASAAKPSGADRKRALFHPCYTGTTTNQDNAKTAQNHHLTAGAGRRFRRVWQPENPPTAAPASPSCLPAGGKETLSSPTFYSLLYVPSPPYRCIPVTCFGNGATPGPPCASFKGVVCSFDPGPCAEHRL